jgi:hypothetical protein
LNGTPSGGTPPYSYQLWSRVKDSGSLSYETYGYAQQGIIEWNLNTFTVPLLTAGTTYEYYITVTDADSTALNVPSPTAPKEFTTATPAIDASSLMYGSMASMSYPYTSQEIFVTYGQASGGSGSYQYVLYIKRNTGSFNPEQMVTTQGWSLINLIGGSSYSYYVTISDPAAQATPSDTSTFTFTTPSYPDLTKGYFNGPIQQGAAGELYYNAVAGSGGSDMYGGTLSNTIEYQEAGGGGWTDFGDISVGVISGLNDGMTYNLRIKTLDNKSELIVYSDLESGTTAQGY